MELITRQTAMYKTIKNFGFLDFPNINARVLYYSDGNNEYAITINLNNKNKIIDIEQFIQDFETLS